MVAKQQPAFVPRDIVYPDSDGEPMSDNTLQWAWIALIKENLDTLLADFVAGDLLWYPVEGSPTTRIGLASFKRRINNSRLAVSFRPA